MSSNKKNLKSSSKNGFSKNEKVIKDNIIIYSTEPENLDENEYKKDVKIFPIFPKSERKNQLNKLKENIKERKNQLNKLKDNNLKIKRNN